MIPHPLSEEGLHHLEQGEDEQILAQHARVLVTACRASDPATTYAMKIFLPQALARLSAPDVNMGQRQIILSLLTDIIQAAVKNGCAGKRSVIGETKVAPGHASFVSFMWLRDTSGLHGDRLTLGLDACPHRKPSGSTSRVHASPRPPRLFVVRALSVWWPSCRQAQRWPRRSKCL